MVHMQQTQTRPDSKAATIPPLLRRETAPQNGLKSETSGELIKLMTDQASKIKTLAAEYEKSGNASTKDELNRENLHLHVQIHVFWQAFKDSADPKAITSEQKELANLQLEANKAIENAAKQHGQKVSYVDIGGIKDKSGKSVGEHIYERLSHPDSNTSQDLINSVEKEVRDALKAKGFDEDMLLNRLFAMAAFMRNDKTEHSEPPAIHIEPDFKGNGASKNGSTPAAPASAEELAKATAEAAKQKALSESMFQEALRLEKKLNRVQKELQTSREVQNIQDGKVHDIQKALTDTERKLAKAKRKLKKAKKNKK